MKLSHSHKIRTMTLTTTKLTEFQLRTSLPLTSHSLFSDSCAPKTSSHALRLHFSSSASLRTNKHSKPRSPNTSPNAPWHSRWPSRKPPLEDPPTKIAQPYAKEEKTRFFTKDKGQNAIERIVLRLRNLGLGVEEGEGVEEGDDGIAAGDFAPVTGEERLADLLKREWIRPDTFFSMKDKENENDDEVVLPWERDEGVEGEGEIGKERKRRVKAPTLAELTLEDEELRRLRRNGMFLRERISIPKAGLTKEVMQKIHDKWRKEELVRLKFHEVLAHDMRTAHELVERRTGGLVTWRAGSVMVVFRGINYQGPPSKSQLADREGNALFVPNVSSADVATVTSQELATSIPGKSKPAALRAECTENMTEEEAEYNQLLDGLGPRFEEWWGTGVLPVDADMLPGKVPGYKTPFRLLPTGMRSRLTNGEMTNLRKLAKSLPCHFALGRNRNHQGLAAAILRLWEKSLVAKIAVKRGIQNTNNKLMADELKNLTGGVLLLRNKYFIVIYRGKDFLPTSVAAALAERQELTKQIQDVEENVRSKEVEAVPSGEDEGMALAGTLAEFYEAQARWGRNVTPEEHEKMIEDASRAKTSRLMKRVEHKLAIAQAKKLRAERLLAKIEVSMVPSGPDYDQETITDEERAMFRRVGLRMKAYLPLGIRGVFDGVIENMHLHWKYRELVKLISKQKTLAFVEDTARLLEYESGGILVAIERVPKGFALIFYRGKNYRRPIKLRPRNLLTKAKALKRSVAMQRHEALSQHISDLEKTIEQMKKEIYFAREDNADNVWSLEEHGQLNPTSEILRSEAEAAYVESEEEEEDDEEEEDEEDDDDDYEDDDYKNEYFIDGEANEDSEFSSSVDRDHFMTNDS